MNLTERVLKALSEGTSIPEVENLRKAVACFDSDPIQSLNFLLQYYNESVSSEAIEHLRLAIVQFDQEPKNSVNSLLRAIGRVNGLENNEGGLSPDIFEHFRLAIVQFDQEPKNSINSLLRAFGQLENTLDFENLRRAFVNIDNDPKQSLNCFLKFISSIKGHESIDEIRKAMLSQENEKLQATSLLLKLIFIRTHSKFIEDLRKTLQLFPDIDWESALSVGQVQSKMWLLDQWKGLDLSSHQCCFILGGWIGLLPALAEENGIALAHNYRSFDIDSKCMSVAESLNKTALLDGWKFKATTWDMLEINYNSFDYQTLRSDGSSVDLSESPDLIINTSCEHISSFDKWYKSLPFGKTIILQSNDFFDEKTHVNCVSSLQEFKEQAPMTKIYFEGALALEKYQRFMLIGQK